MSGIRAVLPDYPAVLHVKLKNVSLRHIDTLDLIQKDFLIKLLQPEDFGANSCQALMADCSAYMATIAGLLLFPASAYPELLIIAVLGAMLMHIAHTAVRTFNLAREAAGIQTWS